MEILCSECSAPVPPIVAVDIDGTLSEYHDAISRFSCNYWNVPLRKEPWNGVGNFEDWLGLTRLQYQEAKLAYRQGGYKRTAAWQPGAMEFMWWLAQQPVEIWITTTRPWNRLDSVDPDTRFWLDRHQVRYDHLLYDDHKYAKLAELVDPTRVICVIDDLPEMIAEAETHLPMACHWLMARSHNATVQHIHCTTTNFVRIRQDLEQFMKANP
jgi:hypothetical protein